MEASKPGRRHCQVCGAEALAELSGFVRLPRVTSDSQPWASGGRLCVCGECGVAQKALDEAWLNEISAIYERYSIYHQAAGAEQPIFTPNGPRLRSEIITETLKREIAPPSHARALDFGCGNGATLRAFSGAWPEWRLYGSELNDGARELLQQLPNFKRLFVGSLTTVQHRFDLITMIHALEHVIEPAIVLSELAGLCETSGRLFVEVPNCAVNPYDLIIADHLTHFTRDALLHLSQRAGCMTQLLSDQVISKELSWIGHRATGAPQEIPPSGAKEGLKRTKAHVEWLAGQIESASEVARHSRRFGIFGTSISGTWLAGALGDAVSFFVDEDPSRIGRYHLGKPILSPAAVFDADVFVALLPDTARGVSKRLSDGRTRYFIPADIAL